MSQALPLGDAPAPQGVRYSLDQRLVAEFVGTFALIFVGCGAIVADVGLVGVALAFGLVVMTMIYAVGDVSGAHFNPAVSLGFAAARRMSPRDAVAYMLAQCVAAMVASLVLWAAFPDTGDYGTTMPQAVEPPASAGPGYLGPPSPAAESGLRVVARAFGYEVILSFFLVFVILCVAIGWKERGLMAGIAIGGTLAFCVLAGGEISGASMNPARSLAPALLSGFDRLQQVWIYCTAPFAGSVAAAGAWMYLYRHADGGADAPAP